MDSELISFHFAFARQPQPSSSRPASSKKSLHFAFAWQPRASVLPGLQTSRASRELPLLGLGSGDVLLCSARSRKPNRFSDSARFGRATKFYYRSRLVRAETSTLYSRTRLTLLGANANCLGCYSNTSCNTQIASSMT